MRNVEAENIKKMKNFVEHRRQVVGPLKPINSPLPSRQGFSFSIEPSIPTQRRNRSVSTAQRDIVSETLNEFKRTSNFYKQNQTQHKGGYGVLAKMEDFKRKEPSLSGQEESLSQRNKENLLKNRNFRKNLRLDHTKDLSFET